MSIEINYKKKYLELRSKYISDLDTAFRLGMEQGMQQAQQQQALDAQAQEAQQQGMVDGMTGEHQEDGQQMQSDMEDSNGSELDQHINKLESMLGSSNPEQSEEIKKSLEAIKSIRKAEKFAVEMNKSDMAIKGISKALHKPSFKIGAQAQHNMTDNAKKGVTLQHKIINDVMKAWKEEEVRANSDIKNILNVENLIKE